MPCFILSDRNDPDEVVMAAQQSIKGCLPTTIAPELALQTIAFVIQGWTYFLREAFLCEAGSTTVGISSQILLPSLRQLATQTPAAPDPAHEIVPDPVEKPLLLQNEVTA